MKFFSPDSMFAKVMTFVGEMMILNICWIIACLPLVTVGAANAAMYTVMMRRLREEGSGTIGPFFQAWWTNLKMGILFWLPQVFVTFSLGLTFFLTLPLAFKIVAGVVLVLVSLLFSVIYPLIARFRNRWFAYLKNAVILLVLRLKWVLLNMLLLLTPVIAFLLTPAEFLRFGWVWIFFGFAGMFFVSSEIVRKILEPLEELAEQRK